jgi:hypothetical protein
VVQESKFPATIGITLIEPSSKLSWHTTYEPSNEITNPASFSLIDAGSLETYFSSIYDSAQPEDEIVYASDPKSIVNFSKDWNSIQDTIPFVIMNHKAIDPHLSVQIIKYKGMICLQFQDPEEVV